LVGTPLFLENILKIARKSAKIWLEIICNRLLKKEQRINAGK
jgi:hypothetical protein